jgi:glycosidase
LVYYGDEVGMPGAGDPDNRRPMQWDGYSAGQSALLEHVQRLTQIRAAHAATRRGTRTTLSSSTDTFAYVVEGAGDALWVAINRADAPRTVDGLPAASFTDELSGASFSGPALEVPARSALVLVMAR